MSNIKDKDFCKMYNSFYGDDLDSPKQLTQITFDGTELMEFIQHCFKQLSHDSTVSGMSAEEIEKMAEKDIPNRFIKTPFGNPQEITPSRERRAYIKGFNTCKELYEIFKSK